MRYAIWTPLPPERSGIADYSFALLEVLAAEADVVAVARDPRTAHAPLGVPVVGADTTFGDGTVHVYQMGNHAAVHSWIYRQALSVPGVVVLHDPSLLDFVSGYCYGKHTRAFREEVRFAHGPIWGDTDDPALLDGWPAIEVDGVKTLDKRTLSLERRLVSASRGVIVHDAFSAAELSVRYPTIPVHHVPHGTRVPDGDGRGAIRASHGWRDGDVVFGIFGGLYWIKRIMVALLAFAQVRRRWPQARLVIAGHTDDAALLADIRATIQEHGIGDSVQVVESPSEREFDDLILASDTVINLRWPSAGETSGVMMRAFGAGSSVIASDLPQHRHLPARICRPVPLDPEDEATVLLRYLERDLAFPEDAAKAGAEAREYARKQASWETVARSYLSAADTPPGDAACPARLGVNAFADPRANNGLAESARRHVVALADADVRVSFTEFNTRAPSRWHPVPERIADLPRGKEFPIDVWFVNINEFQLLPTHCHDRYTIASWAWEMPEPSRLALDYLPRLDELWVVSSFVADAFRGSTSIPITVVPCVVPDPPRVRPDRTRFGIPEDGLVVLFTFSASSSDARKNPWAAIEAFRQAFPPQERGSTAHLVLKVNDLHRFPELARELHSAVASVDGIVIEREMPRIDMDRLLACCDVYLSLHRAEGFGLGMAEAMSMAKPVVATAFGGNVDYMPPGSSALVGYDVRAIEWADHRFGKEFGDWYTPGQLWAEPDTGQAARWLRALASDPGLRSRMGQRGAEAVRARCSPEVVGRLMRERIAAIDPDKGIGRGSDQTT